MLITLKLNNNSTRKRNVLYKDFPEMFIRYGFVEFLLISLLNVIVKMCFIPHFNSMGKCNFS